MAALVGLVLTACSSDEPSIEINNNVVESYKAGGVTRYFKMVDREYFSWDDENSKWILMEGTPLAGSFDNLSAILFTKGEVCTPLYMPMSSRLGNLWIAWGAYKKVTKNRNMLYVSTPFFFNDEAGTVEIEGHPYTVEKMTENQLQIFDDSPITYDGITFIKQLKIVSTYEVSDLSQAEIDNILTFGSKKEAYRYIIKVAKAQFGDKINLNEIYKPDLST